MKYRVKQVVRENGEAKKFIMAIYHRKKGHVEKIVWNFNFED